MTFVKKLSKKTLGYVHSYNWNKSFTHFEHLARVVGREAVNFGNNGNDCRFHIGCTRVRGRLITNSVYIGVNESLNCTSECSQKPTTTFCISMS